MSDIRLVATDLDGTLLRSDKTVSAYTVGVIERMRKAGVLFVAATARPVRSVEAMLPGLAFDALICHNGAVIRSGEKRIGGYGIENPDAVVRALLDALPQSRISVESDEILYANYPADETWPGIEYVFTRDFSELCGRISDKIIVEADSQEKVDAIGALLPQSCYAQLCENRLALCMHKEASKPLALKQTAALFGIGMEQIACFGDDHNDISMLRACGRGVAVANAIDEVKQAADEILALTNDQDGVACWIEENLL